MEVSPAHGGRRPGAGKAKLYPSPLKLFVEKTNKHNYVFPRRVKWQKLRKKLMAVARRGRAARQSTQAQLDLAEYLKLSVLLNNRNPLRRMPEFLEPLQAGASSSEDESTDFEEVIYLCMNN
jgi:hypothetical protein